MGWVAGVLLIVAASVLALAAGMSWPRLMHWAGEVLLVLGISLAAKGISDVRREWTRRPGIWQSTRQRAGVFRVRAASFFWLWWNRAVEKWPRLAKLLHLHIHVTHVELRDVAASAGVAMARMTAGGHAEVSGGTVEDRLARLEAGMADVRQKLESADARHEQEVRERRAAAEEERAARMAGDQGIRERMADLAGGGLRLQAWSVACLIAGTVLTAFY